MNRLENRHGNQKEKFTSEKSYEKNAEDNRITAGLGWQYGEVDVLQ